MMGEQRRQFARGSLLLELNNDLIAPPANSDNEANAALRKLGRYEKAISAYKSAIAIKPDYAMAYYNMGTSLINLRRYEKAISAYKSAIAIKPDDAKAYNNMGVSLRKLGRHEEAI